MKKGALSYVVGFVLAILVLFAGGLAIRTANEIYKNAFNPLDVWGFWPFDYDEPVTVEDVIVDNSMKALVCAVAATGYIQSDLQTTGGYVSGAQYIQSLHNNNWERVWNNVQACQPEDEPDEDSDCSGVAFGHACVTCSPNDEHLYQCDVKDFKLPQPEVTESNADNLIAGYGDPKYIVYWEAFPTGEETYWQADLFSYSTLALYGGAIFSWFIPVGDDIIDLALSGARSGDSLIAISDAVLRSDSLLYRLGKDFWQKNSKTRLAMILNGVADPDLAHRYELIGNTFKARGFATDPSIIVNTVNKHIDPLTYAIRNEDALLDELTDVILKEYGKEGKSITATLRDTARLDAQLYVDDVIRVSLDTPFDKLDMAAAKIARSLRIPLEEIHVGGKISPEALATYLDSGVNSVQAFHNLQQNGLLDDALLDQYVRTLRDTTEKFSHDYKQYDLIADEISNRLLLMQAIDEVPESNTIANLMNRFNGIKRGVDPRSWARSLGETAAYTATGERKFLVMAAMYMLGNMVEHANSKFLPHGSNAFVLHVPFYFASNREYTIEESSPYTMIIVEDEAIGSFERYKPLRLHLVSPCEADLTMFPREIYHDIDRDAMLAFDLYNFGSGYGPVEKGTLVYEQLPVTRLTNRRISQVTSHGNCEGELPEMSPPPTCGDMQGDTYIWPQVTGYEPFSEPFPDEGNDFCSYNLEGDYLNTPFVYTREDGGNRRGGKCCLNENPDQLLRNFVAAGIEFNERTCRNYLPQEIVRRMISLDPVEFSDLTINDPLTRIYNWGVNAYQNGELEDGLKVMSIIVEYYPDTQEAQWAAEVIDSFLSQPLLFLQLPPQTVRELLFDEVMDSAERTAYINKTIANSLPEEWPANTEPWRCLSLPDVMDEFNRFNCAQVLFWMQLLRQEAQERGIGIRDIDIQSLGFIGDEQTRQLRSMYPYAYYYVYDDFDLNLFRDTTNTEDRFAVFATYYQNGNSNDYLTNHPITDAWYIHLNGFGLIPKHLKSQKIWFHGHRIPAFLTWDSFLDEMMPIITQIEQDTYYRDDTKAQLLDKKYFYEQRARNYMLTKDAHGAILDEALQQWYRVSIEIQRRGLVDASKAVKNVDLIEFEDIDDPKGIVLDTMAIETQVDLHDLEVNYCYQAYDPNFQAELWAWRGISMVADQAGGAAGLAICGKVTVLTGGLAAPIMPFCYKGGSSVVNWVTAKIDEEINEERKWPKRGEPGLPTWD